MEKAILARLDAWELPDITFDGYAERPAILIAHGVASAVANVMSGSVGNLSPEQKVNIRADIHTGMGAAFAEIATECNNLLGAYRGAHGEGAEVLEGAIAPDGTEFPGSDNEDEPFTEYGIPFKLTDTEDGEGFTLELPTDALWEILLAHDDGCEERGEERLFTNRDAVLRRIQKFHEERAAA